MSGFTRVALQAILLSSVTACPGGGMPDECPMATASAALSVPETVDVPTCSDWGCGTNSPTVGDGFVFDELDTSEAPVGQHGIEIVNPKLDGHPVRLRVERHFLTAIAKDTGAIYDFNKIVGTTFDLVITKSSVSPQPKFSLKIVDVKYGDSQDPNGGPRNPILHFWAGDTKESVPYYRIVVVPPIAETGTKLISICKRASNPVWREVADYAIAFSGDHYDAMSKTVKDVPESTSLFNLACAGAAPAKMHLTRHTNAGAWTDDHHLVDGHPPYYTTQAQRQAMLKLLTADYCNTGRSFTVDGQPLNYGDKEGLYPGSPMIFTDGALSPGITIEALWNETGAMCLDTPRLAWVPVGPIVPDLRTEVEHECLCAGHPLPPCTGPGGVVSSWADAGMLNWQVISANRAPGSVGAP